MTTSTAVTKVRAILTAFDDGAGSAGLFQSIGLIPSDAMYTASELNLAIQDEERTLKSLQLDLREADLRIKSAEKAFGEGVVKAKINGTVTVVGDPDNPPTDGSAFLTVAGVDGLYIRSALNESAYRHVKEGDTVSLSSWRTGESFEGTIRSIDDFPDTSGMFGYGGNNESYYPMTITVADKNAFENYEWVQVSLNQTSPDSSMEEGTTVTLPKAFVREEEGRAYVFLRGDHDKLVKQEVVLGTLRDDSYTILEGVSDSDYIAFPYGKAVKEGAATREGTMEELYES